MRREKGRRRLDYRHGFSQAGSNIWHGSYDVRLADGCVQRPGRREYALFDILNRLSSEDADDEFPRKGFLDAFRPKDVGRHVRFSREKDYVCLLHGFEVLRVEELNPRFILDELCSEMFCRCGALGANNEGGYPWGFRLGSGCVEDSA